MRSHTGSVSTFTWWSTSTLACGAPALHLGLHFSASALGQARPPSSVDVSHRGVSGGMTHPWNGTSSAGFRLLSSAEGESVLTQIAASPTLKACCKCLKCSSPLSLVGFAHLQ